MKKSDQTWNFEKLFDPKSKLQGDVNEIRRGQLLPLVEPRKLLMESGFL